MFSKFDVKERYILLGKVGYMVKFDIIGWE